MLGLQTALPLALSELDLPVGRVLALMSWQPASIAGLDPSSGGAHGGPIEPGAAANLCVIDPRATWTVEPGALASRSHNTPYGGRRMCGRARHTLFRGEPVVVEAEAQR
jgi:dihydroorotase